MTKTYAFTLTQAHTKQTHKIFELNRLSPFRVFYMGHTLCIDVQQIKQPKQLESSYHIHFILINCCYLLPSKMTHGHNIIGFFSLSLSLSICSSRLNKMQIKLNFNGAKFNLSLSGMREEGARGKGKQSNKEIDECWRRTDRSAKIHK